MRGHVVLIGMMGVGKTSVGQELARLLDVSFTDVDTEIERAAAMTIPEIFERDGETFFRDRESRVLDRILGRPPGVVSTGGGAWIQPRNRELIRAAGLAVWLDADLDTLWARVRHRSTRPLLMTPDPKATLAALLEERGPVYALADLTVKTSGGDVATSARRVRDAIAAAHPDFLETT